MISNWQSPFAHNPSWDVKRLTSLGNSEFKFLLSSIANVRDIKNSITPRFCGHISRFDSIFIELKSLLGITGQWYREKLAAKTRIHSSIELRPFFPFSFFFTPTSPTTSLKRELWNKPNFYLITCSTKRYLTGRLKEEEAINIGFSVFTF